MATGGAVNFALTKTTEIFEGEAKHLAGVHTVAQHVADELEFIKAFLLTQVPAEEDSQPEVEVLNRQVRDIAYDMEYALDDYKLRVARDYGHGFLASLQKISHFLGSSYARHRIATKLHDCESRVQKTLAAYQRHFLNQGSLPRQQASSSTRTSSHYYDLRSCFMYFSIFPEGDPIERMRLVRLWIAEGFVKQSDQLTLEDVISQKKKKTLEDVISQKKETLEDVAAEYLNELVNRNLVQVVEATSDGRVKTCRVHHPWHEFVTSKAKEEGFFATINENSSDFPKKVRRLSIHNANKSIRQRSIPSQLRSVLTFWRADSSSKWHMFNFSSSRLRLLNVLDLRGAPLDAFPKDVISLQCLKYLSLRNTKVNSVPGSIRKLKNLETLDLKHAPVNKLPAEISELQMLRHLLVYHFRPEKSDEQIRTKCGFTTPAQIGKLLSLQKLCFLEVDDILLTQLGKMNQLRRLDIILKLQEADGETLCSVIKAQVNLHSLSVTSTNESEIIDMNFLNSGSCPKFLRRLYLTGPLGKLPDWISSLENLAKVVLKGSRLTDDPLPCLEDLPNLVHLEFNQVHEGDKMTFRSGKFRKLKFLGLNKFVNLRLISVDHGAMPCLQELIIECCQLLQKVPFGVYYLTELRALKFFDMPSDFIRRLRPDGGEDSLKFQHVQEVLGTCRSNGEWEVYSKESFEDAENRAGPTTTYGKSTYEWKD